MDTDSNKIWIILGAVLGTLVLVMMVTLCLFLARRAKVKKLLPTRTVTPLDDAEFESWRRPSEYAQRPSRYTIMPKQHRQPDFTSPPSPTRSRTPSLYEKEMGLDMSPIQQPARAYDPSVHSTRTHGRQRSSISVQDRPPTPYSPTSEKAEVPSWSPPTSANQYRSQRHHSTVSELSDFDFGFSRSEQDAQDYLSSSEKSTHPILQI